MTWKKWVNSKYNTANYEISNEESSIWFSDGEDTLRNAGATEHVFKNMLTLNGDTYLQVNRGTLDRD